MSKLAYIVSRFPKTTETFILNEVKAFQKNEIDLDVYTLLQQKQFVHKKSSGLEARTDRPRIVLNAISGIYFWITRKPGTVVKLLALIFQELKPSPNILFKTVALFSRMLYIAKCCELSEVSHVHCGFANYAATAGLVIYRLTGTQFSITGHANDLFRTKGLLKEKVEHCSMFFVISEYNRRYLLEIVSPDYSGKIKVLRAGADTQIFSYQSNYYKPDVINLLSVASFLEKKGHKYLIDAVAILNSRGFKVHCSLVGDGPLRANIECQIEKHGLQNSITLHGTMSQESVHGLLSNAFIFVLPCVEARDGVMDGIPVAIMEAMAMGIPVVTTSVSGIPELIVHNKTGLLAKQHDEQDLADQIQRLLENEQLFSQLSVAANSLVRKDYDMRKNYNVKAQAVANLLTVA